MRIDTSPARPHYGRSLGVTRRTRSFLRRAKPRFRERCDFEGSGSHQHHRGRASEPSRRRTSASARRCAPAVRIANTADWIVLDAKVVEALAERLDALRSEIGDESLGWYTKRTQ